MLPKIEAVKKAFFKTPYQMHNKSLLGSDFQCEGPRPLSAGQWLASKLDKTLYKKDLIKAQKEFYSVNVNISGRPQWYVCRLKSSAAYLLKLTITVSVAWKARIKCLLIFNMNFQ